MSTTANAYAVVVKQIVGFMSNDPGANVSSF